MQKGVAVLSLLAALLASRAPAQTLTSTRGLFEIPDSLRGNSKEMIAKRRRIYSDSIIFAVHADGNLRAILSGQGKDAPSVATGAVTINLASFLWSAEASISAISNVDTLYDGFGGSMLYPISKGKQLLLDGRRLFWRVRSFPLGLHAYYSYAPSTWSALPPGGSAFLHEDVLLQTAGTQFTVEGFNLLLPDIGEVSLLADYGVAWRGLGGNIAGDRGRPLRLLALGTDKTNFIGQELTFSLQVRQVRFGTSLYSFRGDIPGFSVSHQSVFGVSVASPLFRRTINRPDFPLGL